MSLQKNGDTLNVGGSTDTKKVDSGTARPSSWHGPWEFFKDVIGLRTRPINQQIGLASTVVTPDISLATKAIFVNIFRAKDMLQLITQKIKQINDNVNKDHSETLKQKQIVKINIVNAYKKYEKEKKGEE